MAQETAKIEINPALKEASQELFTDLGLDLATAVTIFLRQAVRVQGLPFPVTREAPNDETSAAMNEYYDMKAHPERYKRYPSFKAAMRDVLGGDI